MFTALKYFLNIRITDIYSFKGHTKIGCLFYSNNKYEKKKKDFKPKLCT